MLRGVSETKHFSIFSVLLTQPLKILHPKKNFENNQGWFQMSSFKMIEMDKERQKAVGSGIILSMQVPLTNL